MKIREIFFYGVYLKNQKKQNKNKQEKNKRENNLLILSCCEFFDLNVLFVRENTKRENKL